MGAASLDDLISTDEVGLAYVRHRDTLLKAAYQPIYRLARHSLYVWGVEGSIRAIRIPGARLQADEPEPDADIPFFQVSLALQIRNFRDFDEGLRLVLNYGRHLHADFDAALGVLRFIAVELLRADIDPRRLVCTVQPGKMPDRFDDLLAAIGREGMSPVVEKFGFNALAVNVERRRVPFVRFEPRWLARIAGSGAALRLLSSLSALLREHGTEIMATGIDNPAMLTDLAQAGIRYFRGDLLSRPVLAGMIISDAPIRLSAIDGRGGAVVPFLR